MGRGCSEGEDRGRGIAEDMQKREDERMKGERQQKEERTTRGSEGGGI